ncbi:syncytin-2-like [Alligator mississippiensis]|uniref:syncytin-2-like n=1 Tax=Alligator mississippiensis TaxID=8496 RepID=UPI002877445C|nr:syncytin-2-like [Alligator mississippiensis]
MWKVVLCIGVMFLESTELVHQRFEKSQNVWVHLAKDVLNVTHFCLVGGISVDDIFTSCLIGVPTPMEALQNQTWFTSRGIGGPINYTNNSMWGTITTEKNASTFEIDLLTVTSPGNTSCANFVNCTQACKSLTKETKIFNCSDMTNVSCNYVHVILPRGWFLLCGKTAYSYIPANATGGPCALGRLTVWLPGMPKISSKRHRRGSKVLDKSCDSDINLLSEAEVVSLAVFLVGVPGLVVDAERQLGKVACALAKGLNTTSQALAALNIEMKELRGATLQNRAAIDHLLLRHNHGCEEFEGMCCFNLTDNSELIESKVQKLKKVLSYIKQGERFDFSWLTSWLPNFSWFKQIFLLIVASMCIFLMICCGIQCAPMCCEILKKSISSPVHRVMFVKSSVTNPIQNNQEEAKRFLEMRKIVENYGPFP